MTHLSQIIFQKQWDSVSPFLKSCPGLTREQQNVFEDYAKQVEERLAAAEAEEKAKMEAELSAQEKQKRKQTQERHTDKGQPSWSLTHCGLVTPYGDTYLGQHWLRLWLVAWWHQAITWTNIDLSSERPGDIHLRSIWQEILSNH